MRAFVEPPPSSRCDLCGGELRLKLIDACNPTLGMKNELFVCAKCGCERAWRKPRPVRVDAYRAINSLGPTAKRPVDTGLTQR
jgi:hypothetical protein